MSELDLLNLARSTTEHQVTWFAQMITINFGMVVTIYYFCMARNSRSRYSPFRVQRRNGGASGGNVGENIKVGVIETLHALPAEHLSRPIVRFLSVYDSLARAHHANHLQSFYLVVLASDVLSALLLETKLEPARFQIISDSGELTSNRFFSKTVATRPD